MYNILEVWNLIDRVQFMYFDTTASSTDISTGYCTILEQELNKDIFSLACIHHIMELSNS